VFWLSIATKQSSPKVSGLKHQFIILSHNFVGNWEQLSGLAWGFSCGYNQILTGAGVHRRLDWVGCARWHLHWHVWLRCWDGCNSWGLAGHSLLRTSLCDQLGLFPKTAWRPQGSQTSHMTAGFPKASIPRQKGKCV